MASFKPEKLLPVIRITRKLKASDTQQQLKVLQQLPQLFQHHDAISVLRNILLAGICNHHFYEKMAIALFSDIELTLPSDDELDLIDTVYESKLLEIPEDIDEDSKGNTLKRKKLPLTLLRIPSDLQYHLFHFLDHKELTEVQKVCRALCLTARNPSSLYSIHLQANECTKYEYYANYFREWLSRPRSLTIDTPSTSAPIYIGGNVKWPLHVTDLSITSYGSIEGTDPLDLRHLGHFENVIKCEIWHHPDILFNGKLSSYFTLKELILYDVIITDDTIGAIQKFKNMERLTLRYPEDFDLERTDYLCSASIHFAKLRELTIEAYIAFPDIFQGILIGSYPSIVAICLRGEFRVTLPQSDAFMQAIRAVKHLNIDVLSMDFINALYPLLQKAKREKFPFFEECQVTLPFIEDECDISASPIVTLFECAKSSRLQLHYYTYSPSKDNVGEFVQEICNAPYGTFNEIAVHFEYDFRARETGVNVFSDSGSRYRLFWDECRQRDIVRRVVMESIDNAEEWLQSWLLFDKKKMKQIGLRKLNIEFKYILNTAKAKNWSKYNGSNDERRFDQVLEKMGDEWLQERVDCWSAIDHRCSTKYEEDGLTYAVTLSLRL